MERVDPAAGELAEFVRRTHGAEPTWVHSVEVAERFRELPDFRGTVHVYDLAGHPEAKRAYAWMSVGVHGERRPMAVLHVGVVDRPEAAVRATLVTEYRARLAAEHRSKRSRGR